MSHSKISGKELLGEKQDLSNATSHHCINMDIFHQAILHHDNRIVAFWDQSGQLLAHYIPNDFHKKKLHLLSIFSHKKILKHALQGLPLPQHFPSSEKKETLECTIGPSDYWFSTNFTHIKSPDRQIIAYVFFLEDHSEENRAIQSKTIVLKQKEHQLLLLENELRKKENHYKQILAMTTDCIIEARFQKKGNISAHLIWATHSFTKIFGYDLFSFNKKYFHEHASKEDQPKLCNSLESILDDTNCRIETRICLANGSHKWLEINAKPLKDDRNNIFGFVAGLKDISAQKHLETKIGNYQQELENTIYLRGLELEEQVQERIAAERNVYALKEKLLRLQMNPHFIFNSLLAIQSFIYSKPPELAGAYLIDFANLIRIMIDNTSKEMIPLDREIKSLRYYLRLQKLRFNDLFDYEIKISEKDEEKNMMVPPMLGQPFIENAIDHAFKNSNTKGRIQIIFKFEADQLRYIIEDNGIGRANAQAINKNGFQLHKSHSVGTTQERIQQLREQHAVDIEFKIEDLHHKDQTAAGTRVSFYISHHEACQ